MQTKINNGQLNYYFPEKLRPALNKKLLRLIPTVIPRIILIAANIIFTRKSTHYLPIWPAVLAVNCSLLFLNLVIFIVMVLFAGAVGIITDEGISVSCEDNSLPTGDSTSADALQALFKLRRFFVSSMAK